ncbi:hypothetical protein F5Y12DRAFT_793488 [Xylaria sp. FL1777]|nr:hypothetical protein F5Y12DRAFT_793488 [Xylaria sp. FL1777]
MKMFGLWGRYMGASTGWKKAAKVNCVLLTFICIILLASSNFFMQVLNAPSRDELDVAHRRGKWLEIGVSSMRNLFVVSKFKTWCWLGLSITSLPIHVLFNSAIFSTEYRESDFTITIATEELLNGGPYYLPGASLLSGDSYKPGFTGDRTSENSSIPVLYNFGQLFNMSEYTTKGSGVERNISDAALHGNELDRLEFSDCQREFGLYGAPCNGLTRYRDVILVVQNSAGWKRNEMWHLMDNQTRNCESSCYYALGGTDSDITSEWPSGYPFFSDDALAYVNGTNADRFGYEYSYHQNDLTSGLQPGTFNLSVQYCLAEAIESTCHIGVSPVSLSVVLVCVICKTSIAVLVTVILGRRNQRPLVTLGDCLASFIENPDVKNSHFSAIALANMREGYILSGRNQWQFPSKRRAAVVPHRSWFLSYHLFGSTIVACVVLLTFSAFNNGGIFIGYFLLDNRNPLLGVYAPTFLGCVLVANTPQFVLSLWYFCFNNLFTRFQLAAEWEQYGNDFSPLRVTEPEGKQNSTYRLQLPYKYSFPLIILSATLHWLLSNTIYTIVSIGGYLNGDIYDSNPHPDPSLSNDATAALGYSPVSLFIVAVLAATLITIPLLFSLKRISPHIMPGGTNSLLLSMACRVSLLLLDERSTAPERDVGSEHSFLPHPLPNRNTEGSGESDSLLQLIELRFPLESHDGSETREGYSGIGERELSDEVQTEDPHASMDDGELGSDMGGGELQGNTDETEDSADALQRIARSEIRWGVLKMPHEWYDEHDYEPLGFATRGEEVTTPVQGEWYL